MFILAMFLVIVAFVAVLKHCTAPSVERALNDRETYRENLIKNNTHTN